MALLVAIVIENIIIIYSDSIYVPGPNDNTVHYSEPQRLCLSGLPVYTQSVYHRLPAGEERS